jgi:hypothetical protein
MTAKNIENFNVVTGVIFATLYKSFPVPVDLRIKDFDEYLSLEGIDLLSDDKRGRAKIAFLTSTILWLADHGYLKTGPMALDGSMLKCTLTATTLELLNAFPSSLANKGPSLGEELISASKDGVKGKLKDFAGELLSKAVVFGVNTAQDWASS